MDSTTASNTAHPVSFGGLSAKHYRVFQNQEKIMKYSPVGLAADNDKIRQEDTTDRVIDTGYVSYALSPINVLNNAIRNFYQNLERVQPYLPHLVTWICDVYKIILALKDKNWVNGI